MDKEALDRSIARRLIDHIEHHTTDMADEVLELPADVYTSEEHYQRELDVLFRDQPLVLLPVGRAAATRAVTWPSRCSGSRCC